MIFSVQNTSSPIEEIREVDANRYSSEEQGSKIFMYESTKHRINLKIRPDVDYPVDHMGRFKLLEGEDSHGHRISV